jgi:hypothetical protein|tara:strand:- start:194 stop:460 length:267 start_codon:yes stop_codon:yes gene_type:complete
MNNKIRKNKMTKYKLEKHNDGRPCYKYRDFVIANKNVFLNTPATWVVKLEGVVLHQNGNGTRKEMMEWVDGYFQEMNDFLNSSQFIND